MIVQPIFQTPIFIENFNGLTNQLGLEEYIKQCCYETPHTFDNTEFIQSRRDLQTVDHDLQKQEIMQPLCRKIYDMMHSIVNIYQYSTYHMEITSMWGNIQRPNTHFRRHSHYNNMFSGVFYLNENENFPNIMFWRFLAGPVTVIPLYLYLRGVELAGLGTSGMVFFITPTGQFLLGIFYYNEIFNVHKLIGFIFIWIAVIIYLKDLNQSK